MPNANDVGRPVVLVCNDMFFSTRILSTARAMGVIVQVVATLEAMREKAPGAGMVIVDLDTTVMDPCAAVRAAKEAGAGRVVGYLPHVQAELGAAAKAAGADVVLPRSTFSAKLDEILRVGRGGR